MLLGRDGTGGSTSRRLGTLRSMCLLVITFGIVILFALSYIDQYQSQICRRRRESIDANPRRNRANSDDVNDDGDNDVSGDRRGTSLDGGEVDEQRKERKTSAKDDDDDKYGSMETKSVSTMASLPSPSWSSGWDYDWDAFAAEAAELDQENTPDRTLVLVRHGQYDYKTEKLTELGREQAAITGRRLRAENITFDGIVHSTMDRADETARIIHSCLLGNNSIPIRPDEMLVEGGPIPPKPTVTYWQLPQQTYHRDGPRMEAAFRKYFHRAHKKQPRHTYQLLVGHGNIFRFFALRALQLSKDAWMRVFIAHASITVLHIRRDGTVAMTRFGDSGHFPVDKVTY